MSGKQTDAPMIKWSAVVKRLRAYVGFSCLVLTRPAIFTSQKSYLFLLSHMRSYSSLLAHILGSHEEIAGYSEIHKSYTGGLDLIKLRYHVYCANHHQLTGKFVLDKIVQPHTISTAILNQNNVQLIFLLRKPEPTIKSILTMGFRSFKGGWYRASEKALNYYALRLKQLEAQSLCAKQRPLFVTSEALLDDTDRVLEFLTRQLQLSSPLRERYSIFKYTGLPGHGDPSARIKEGAINRDQKTYENVVVSQEILKKGYEAYDHCHKVLLETCASVNGNKIL